MILIAQEISLTEAITASDYGRKTCSMFRPNKLDLVIFRIAILVDSIVRKIFVKLF